MVWVLSMQERACHGCGYTSTVTRPWARFRWWFKHQPSNETSRRKHAGGNGRLPGRRTRGGPRAKAAKDEGRCTKNKALTALVGVGGAKPSIVAQKANFVELFIVPECRLAQCQRSHRQAASGWLSFVFLFLRFLPVPVGQNVAEPIATDPPCANPTHPPPPR